MRRSFIVMTTTSWEEKVATTMRVIKQNCHPTGNKQIYVFIEMINKAGNLCRGKAINEPAPSKS